MRNNKNKNYFKIPNDIFNNLNSSEIKVLCAIYSLRCNSIFGGYKYIKIKQANIARICGFSSTRTISLAINKLCLYGYIKRIDRHFVDLHKLGTNVYTIPVVKTNYFFVSRNIFRYKLTPSQFRMYVFLCKCIKSSTRCCWNSYNDICAALHLKRSSVINTINELTTIGIIKKYRVKNKNGSYSDNHYKVIELKFKYKFAQKKKRHRHKLSPKPQTISFLAFIFCNVNKPRIFILRHKLLIVNRVKEIYFFNLRGSPKICTSDSSTHFLTNRRRKNKRRLYLKYRCNLTLFSKDKPG